MPTVETEGDVLRCRCGCGSRAVICGPFELRFRFESLWLQSHAGCETEAERLRRRARDRYRAKVGSVRRQLCTRCDGEGHSVRTCPLPPDVAEIDHG